MSYTLLVYDFQCQEKKYMTKKNLKHLGDAWVPMNFHGTKKLLLMITDELWAWNRKTSCFQWELKSWDLEYIAVLNNYLGYSDNHAANLSFR